MTRCVVLLQLILSPVRCSPFLSTARRSRATPADRGGLPAAQRLDDHAGRQAGSPDRPAAEHPRRWPTASTPSSPPAATTGTSCRSSTSTTQQVVTPADPQELVRPDRSPRAQDQVWWSGGGAGVLHTFDLRDQKLVRTSPAEPYPEKLTEEDIAQLRKDVRAAAALPERPGARCRRQGPLLPRHQRRHDSAVP